jgi:uncharacterized NAD-dependent epimerase/dehydratase family protein
MVDQVPGNSSVAHQDARRLIILTEGHSEPIAAKTAASVLRYKPDEVVALLDTAQAGKTAQQLLGVGGDTPVVASLDAVPAANALMLGIAPPGGRIPAAWRPVILGAIDRGMHVISGLHDFLSADPVFSKAAQQKGISLVDVRQNNERDVANRQNIRQQCLRIHTVGQDCSLGKMLVALEVSHALERAGQDSKFVATGQTGIMIEGDGTPIDCVVADFVSGAVEKLVLANQHHEVLLIEGQGSLAHPRYSGVTLSLLHGCLPQGMIMCYEVGRKNVNGMEHVPLTSLPKLIEVYETMANLMGPSQVIGVAMNSRNVSADEAEREREHVRNALGLPVCDVIRHGPDELVQAVQAMLPQLATS